MFKRIRHRLQHALNPLHLFCRLRDAGMRPWLARRIADIWEQGVYKMIL